MALLADPLDYMVQAAAVVVALDRVTEAQEALANKA